MNMNVDSITLQPVGVVRVAAGAQETVPIPGRPAQIEVYPQYSAALLRIAEHSHLWILSWFHKSDRHALITVPARINPHLPEYGIFGLRSPNRPNPIGLSLVHLVSVQGNVLQVTGMDAMDGTPVLDIKPYFEQDIVFSPVTPYIRPYSLEMRRDLFLKEALTHHQEKCADLYMAVRMALIADEFLGHLNQPDVHLKVSGSRCLADVLQGLSRARLANPARFVFDYQPGPGQSTWEKGGQQVIITAIRSLTPDKFLTMTDAELFMIDWSDPS